MYFTDQNIIQRVDPTELNFEGLEMQECNIPTDRIQRVDEKSGVICLEVIFTPRATVTEMSKNIYFLYFVMMTAKN